VTSGGFSSSWFPYLWVALLFWDVCLPGLGSLPLKFLFLSLSWVLSFISSLAGFDHIIVEYTSVRLCCWPECDLVYSTKFFPFKTIFW
jgi:hypothetical protein